MTEHPTNPIKVPGLCPQCRANLIKGQLGLGPEDSWQVAELIGSILLFQRVTAEPDVQRRSALPGASLQSVLDEYGCIGCAFPGLIADAGTVLRQGTSHAAAVSQGKVIDPAHPCFSEVFHGQIDGEKQQHESTP